MSYRPDSTPNEIQKRRELSLMLAANGLTHGEIAKQLNVSVSSVKRYLEDSKPTIAEGQAILDRYRTAIDTLYSIEDSALDYVDQAQNDKTSAVRLAARIRLDELRGVPSLKARNELTDEPHQPMFVLPKGANVSVTVNQVQMKPSTVVDTVVDTTVDITPTADESE